MRICNEEAEKCALGCALLDEKGLKTIVRKLKPEHFYSPSLRTLMEAVSQLAKAGDPVDLVTVMNKLGEMGEYKKVGGSDFLVGVAESVPSTANANAYANIVLEWWRKREMVARIDEAKKRILESEGDKEVWRFARDCAHGLADGLTVDRTIQEVLDAVAEEDASGESFGVPTGIWWLDRLTSVKGLPIGEPVIITAPTGKGKSALATQIALSLSERGKNVGIATYEMTPEALTRRLLKHICGMTHKPMEPVLAMEYESAMDTLRDPMMGQIRFYDPSYSDGETGTVEALVRWHELTNQADHVDCLIVDYAQLIGSERRFNSSVEELVHVTRCIGKSIRKTRSSCIVLSQQNKEGETSGSRELMKIASAIYQISEDQDQIKIIKSRHGKSGVCIGVEFDERYLKYEAKQF